MLDRAIVPTTNVCAPNLCSAHRVSSEAVDDRDAGDEDARQLTHDDGPARGFYYL